MVQNNNSSQCGTGWRGKAGGPRSKGRKKVGKDGSQRANAFSGTQSSVKGQAKAQGTTRVEGTEGGRSKIKRGNLNRIIRRGRGGPRGNVGSEGKGPGGKILRGRAGGQARET